MIRRNMVRSPALRSLVPFRTHAHVVTGIKMGFPVLTYSCFDPQRDSPSAVSPSPERGTPFVTRRPQLAAPGSRFLAHGTSAFCVDQTFY